MIQSINQIATTIAAAVEEQGAATLEIARNVQEAAQGTAEVSSNTTGLSQAAASTGSAANQVMTSAKSLGDQADELRNVAEGFVSTIRDPLSFPERQGARRADEARRASLAGHGVAQPSAGGSRSRSE